MNDYRKLLIIKNVGRNAIIVDGVIIKKDESTILQKESEVIIAGEPLIISNYEFMNYMDAINSEMIFFEEHERARKSERDSARKRVRE